MNDCCAVIASSSSTLHTVGTHGTTPTLRSLRPTCARQRMNIRQASVLDLSFLKYAKQKMCTGWQSQQPRRQPRIRFCAMLLSGHSPTPEVLGGASLAAAQIAFAAAQLARRSIPPSNKF